MANPFSNIHAVAVVLQLVREYGDLFHRFQDAPTLDEKVRVVIAVGRKAAAQTATEWDDAILRLVDQVGEDKAVDAIVALLRLAGYEDAGVYLSAAAPEAMEDAARAKGEEMGVSPAVILGAIQAVKLFLEYAPKFVELFRHRKAG